MAVCMTKERADYLLKLWDQHIATEFTEKSADAAVATMVPHSTVNHVPCLTGCVWDAKTHKTSC